MTESEIFREALLRLMQDKGMSAAELSRKAGLNARAVKDIEENRVQSPKLSTVFKLAKALNCDPGEMMGLGKRPRIQSEVAAYLGRYTPEEQERLLAALRAIPAPPDADR